MLRIVTSALDLSLSGPVKLVFSVAVAQGAPLQSETLTFLQDGHQVEATELVDAHGSPLHVLEVTAVVDDFGTDDGSQLVALP